jgi:hypothetical protein
MAGLSKVIRGVATNIRTTIGAASSKASQALFGKGNKRVSKKDVQGGERQPPPLPPRPKPNGSNPLTDRTTNNSQGPHPVAPKGTNVPRDPFKDLDIQTARPEDIRSLAKQRDQDGNNILHRLALNIENIKGDGQRKIEVFLDQLAYCKNCLGDKQFKTLLVGDVNDKNRNPLSVIRQQLARFQVTQQTTMQIKETFDVDVFVRRNDSEDGWKM